MKNPSPSQDNILALLRTIPFPGTQENIVDRGALASLTMKEEGEGSHVQMILEVDPTEVALMQVVQQEIEKLIGPLPGIVGVSVVLTAHKAAPQAKPQAKQAAAGMQKQLPKGVKAVIAVASGKGGVGKSTVAVNLAAALARRGLKVGILDADVYGPSMPRLVGQYQADDIKQSGNGMIEPVDAFGMAVMSIGFLVPEDAPMIWRGPMVHGAIKQMLYEVEWGHRDILVIDMPPGTGDAALSVAQQLPLSGAVIVSTPQDIALIDVRKGIAMFQKVGVPILGIIENMSFFECPHCKQKTAVFGHGGARLDSTRLEVPFLGEIPLDMLLRETSDEGVPIVVSQPESSQAQSFIVIADTVIRSL